MESVGLAAVLHGTHDSGHRVERSKGENSIIFPCQLGGLRKGQRWRGKTFNASAQLFGQHDVCQNLGRRATRNIKRSQQPDIDLAGQRR